MLADSLSQINGRKHATTQVAPNLAYSDPEMAEIALRNIERRAKHKVTRPEIKVGDMVRIRVKPIVGARRCRERVLSGSFGLAGHVEEGGAVQVRLGHGVERVLQLVGLSEGLEDAAQPTHDGGPHVLVGLLVGEGEWQSRGPSAAAWRPRRPRQRDVVDGVEPRLRPEGVPSARARTSVSHRMR